VSQTIPKVLFSSAAFFARPLSDTFRLVAEAGYEGVEVMVTKDPASQDPRQMRALAKEYGLTIGALHAPALLLTRKVWGTDPIGKIDRALEVAQDAEIPVVVTHPPYRWQWAYRRWIEDHLPDLTRDTGVILAIENMFPVRMGERAVTFHANQDLDDLEGLPDLVLDTSHAAVARHDLLDVRRRFGDRLRHVHLSDNAGKGWDSHLPPGEGVLDLDAFLSQLAADGYQGSISLEVDLRQYLTHPDRLRTVMLAMREHAEGRLAVTA
jgi:sugar phosphate isomerase/epimerase